MSRWERWQLAGDLGREAAEWRQLRGFGSQKDGVKKIRLRDFGCF
jgi:hypothetical protein